MPRPKRESEIRWNPVAPGTIIGTPERPNLRYTWDKRLARAERRGWFSLDDAKTANSHTYCAVGEARNYDESYRFQHTTLDAMLDRYAMTFFHAVTANDVAGARGVYNDIRQLLANHKDQ